MLFGIINIIAYGFFAVGWGLLVWPFVTILNIITELFGSISFDLLKNIFFGSSKEFSISQIPIVFLIITAIAVSLIIFLILQRLVRNFFLAGKQNYDSSLKNVIIKTIASVVFPILFIVFLFFGLIIVSSIINLIKDSLGYHNSLVSSFVKAALPPEVRSKLTDSDLKSLASGQIISYDIYYNFQWGDGVKIIFLIGLSTLITAWLLGSTVISLVANIAQMFYQLTFITCFFQYLKLATKESYSKNICKLFEVNFESLLFRNFLFHFSLFELNFSTNQAWNIEIKSQLVSPWIFNFFFSFLMILGGGIAIKTIGEEFASYFGGQGFVRSQQEWAHRTTKGIGITAGLLGASSALAGKGVKDSKKLTGYHDAKREEINNAFKKGEITRTQKREMLENLRMTEGILVKLLDQVEWITNIKNILTRAWRAKNAYKEGKDLGVIEEAKYLGSKMLFRHNIRGIENKEAKISKNQLKIDKVQKAIDFENYKKNIIFQILTRKN
ncbi:Mbov_0396 family ICE element transmembrane protein [Mesomycoplasma ovipneumoniae]|uniref:Mbov_0396 family ICE element transmembrane protein n=1 Tax=Mesomycoplasma ovipneumoniae TaxID=29562 RepID=UPI0028AC3957|nr:hypothetical protein [Mesomycoplasma ovipneumoniae]WNM14775.1 hypothetical protein RNM01_03465 [Mesomycoplasma ovipneumoniae]